MIALCGWKNRGSEDSVYRINQITSNDQKRGLNQAVHGHGHLLSLWVVQLFHIVWPWNSLFSKNENTHIGLSSFHLFSFAKVTLAALVKGGGVGCFLIWHWSSYCSSLLWLSLNKNISEMSAVKHVYRTFWSFLVEILTTSLSWTLRGERQIKKEAVNRKVSAASSEFLDYFSCGLIFPWWEAVPESSK